MAIVNTQPIDSNLRAKTLSEAIKDPQAYRGIFNKAYVNLGQPEQSIDPNENRAAVATSGTQELAEAFVDRYYEKTGKLPDANTVSDFVANNLTDGFAQRYITGEQPREITKARLVDPYLDTIGATSKNGSQSISEQDLAKKVEDLYRQVEDSGRAGIDRVFAPQRQRAIEEEASMPGRLRSGVSYAKASPIAQTDERQSNTLSDLLGNIAQQRATGQFNLASQLANLSQNENQFTRNLGLQRQQFQNQVEQQDRDYALQQQQLRLSQLLGKLQAQNKSGGVGKMIGGGLSGAGSGALTGSLISPGLGTLIGGLVGLGAGIYGGSQS